VEWAGGLFDQTIQLFFIAVDAARRSLKHKMAVAY
jgi:hypothetical protein